MYAIRYKTSVKAYNNEQMNNKECYLKFKEYDESITITKDHSDITINEFYQMCKQISTAKFGEHNTKKFFDS